MYARMGLLPWDTGGSSVTCSTLVLPTACRLAPAMAGGVGTCGELDPPDPVRASACSTGSTLTARLAGVALLLRMPTATKVCHIPGASRSVAVVFTVTTLTLRAAGAAASELPLVLLLCAVAACAVMTYSKGRGPRAGGATTTCTLPRGSNVMPCMVGRAGAAGTGNVASAAVAAGPSPAALLATAVSRYCLLGCRPLRTTALVEEVA